MGMDVKFVWDQAGVFSSEAAFLEYGLKTYAVMKVVKEDLGELNLRESVRESQIKDCRDFAKFELDVFRSSDDVSVKCERASKSLGILDKYRVSGFSDIELDIIPEFGNEVSGEKNKVRGILARLVRWSL